MVDRLVLLAVVFFLVDRFAVFFLAVFFLEVVLFLVDFLAAFVGRFRAVFFFVAITEAPEGQIPKGENWFSSPGASMQRKEFNTVDQPQDSTGQVQLTELGHLHHPAAFP